MVALSAGYTPETDEKGKERWPRGDEKAWKAGLRGVDKGTFLVSPFMLDCYWGFDKGNDCHVLYMHLPIQDVYTRDCFVAVRILYRCVVDESVCCALSRVCGCPGVTAYKFNSN